MVRWTATLKACNSRGFRVESCYCTGLDACEPSSAGAATPVCGLPRAVEPARLLGPARDGWYLIPHALFAECSKSSMHTWNARSTRTFAPIDKTSVHHRIPEPGLPPWRSVSLPPPAERSHEGLTSRLVPPFRAVCGLHCARPAHRVRAALVRPSDHDGQGILRTPMLPTDVARPIRSHAWSRAARFPLRSSRYVKYPRRPAQRQAR